MLVNSNILWRILNTVSQTLKVYFEVFFESSDKFAKCFAKPRQNDLSKVCGLFRNEFETFRAGPRLKEFRDFRVCSDFNDYRDFKNSKDLIGFTDFTDLN